MRVLIFHGYLLRGTGSNVYNASLAAALASLGHEVHLVCQERDPPPLAAAGAPGTVTVHNPAIEGLLPVFVHDTYEGFEVKTFGRLTDTELDRYIELNVDAVRDVVAGVGGVDAALANHLVMGPVILRRSGLRYAIKVHGSDLSYTVLPELERFGPYAREACEGASGILVGSGHIAERLRLAVDDPATNAKVRLGPPGVDTTLFAPIPPSSRPKRLRELATGLRPGGEGDAPPAAASGRVGGGIPVSEKPDYRAGSRRTPGSVTHPPPSPTTWDRDLSRAATAIDWFARSEGPRVVFVGKLIVSKGVDLLLASWPLVAARVPRASLLLVGFGSLAEPIERLLEAMRAGDLGPLRELATRGRALEGGPEAPLPILASFLDSTGADYGEAAAEAASRVRIAGRLKHGEVARLVPACDALVFPSTFPEAFGMVAAEAAAAGVLPVSAAHSGAAEVSRELAARLPEPLRPLTSFPVAEGAVEAIAERVAGWLSLPERDREDAAVALRATVERLWSWEGVARGVLAAAAGELDALPAPQAT